MIFVLMTTNKSVYLPLVHACGGNHHIHNNVHSDSTRCETILATNANDIIRIAISRAQLHP